jgi:adenylate cyclase
MRFATKILIFTLAITLSLAAIVVVAVTVTITRAETARARRSIDATFRQYDARLDARAVKIRSDVEKITGEPETRAYLSELQEAGDRVSVETKTHLHEELLGRVLQTELTDPQNSQVVPAFHVLADARGRVLLVKANDAAAESVLARLPWPVEPVLDRDVPPRFYVELRPRLHVVIGVPVRVALNEPATIAYFVAYEINDAWLDAVAGAADLRVLIQWDRRTLARSVADEDAERVLRGVAIRHSTATSHSLEFRAHGERFLADYRLIPAGRHALALILYSSLDQALHPLRQIQMLIAVVTLVAVALAVIASRLLARALAKPVEQLVAGTARIAAGNFNVPIDARRRDELGQLARSFNQMAAGLEQRDLIKDTFGKFIDPKIVQSLLDDPDRLRLGGERRVQTVLFADIENFTTLSEKLSPEDLFRLLNGYLEDAADLVSETKGIIDKFIGDGVVAFWGPPLEEQHAAAACRAALGFVRRAAAHDQQCRELSVPPLRVRVGVATGELLVGNIGSKSKYSYTVMGDVANLASRLEGVNKLYGTQILVSTRTAAEAALQGIVSRKIDTVRVVGRREPVEMYEVLGQTNAADGELARRRDAFARALAMYSKRQWEEARVAFERIDEPPAVALAGRCAVFQEQDPGSTWDGVWNLDRK